MTEALPSVRPLLRMRGVCKDFPGVRALRDVEVTLGRGEVLALLGENGAGKSTLIKILGGALRPDRGTIELDGRTVGIASPREATRLGIGIIHQELNLIPNLSARENIFLGREESRWGWPRVSAERERARQLFARLGMDLDPDTPCRRLTVAQQQVVEIARALSLEARLLVMDEPSTALTEQEVGRLLAIVRELRSQGLGLIYVSHRLPEIFAVADRVLVLRDGQRVGERPISALSREAMIEMMVGRPLDQEFPKRPARCGPPRLVVRGLCRGRQVRDVSFAVRRGEVLGLTGLVGAGRTETARLLFGADRAAHGSITLDGRPLRIRSPRQALAAGICLLTEDRKSQGLILAQSVLDNFGLPNLSRFARLGFVSRRREGRAFERHVASLRIKVHGPRQRAATLSGGNQQKVVLAKWLERNAEVIIFDEPTRGIDVGAKQEIYQLINQLAADGKAILLISSELPEVLGMSDRILVMHAGRIAGEIVAPATATQQDIMRLALAGQTASAD